MPQTVFNQGTIFLSPDIITENDPSALAGFEYIGQGMRNVFDRRTNGWVQINAFLFAISFNDGLRSEAIVNPEFGSVEAATQAARFYAQRVGQLPTALRRDVDAIWDSPGHAAVRWWEPVDPDPHRPDRDLSS